LPKNLLGDFFYSLNDQAQPSLFSDRLKHQVRQKTECPLFSFPQTFTTPRKGDLAVGKRAG
jgi:hypothetical protein